MGWQEQMRAKEEEIDRMVDELVGKEQEMRKLRNNDAMSVDQSSISVQEYSRVGYSFEISEIFRNSPE